MEICLTPTSVIMSPFGDDWLLRSMRIICVHSMKELQANEKEPCAELRIESA